MQLMILTFSHRLGVTLGKLAQHTDMGKYAGQAFVKVKSCIYLFLVI